jgi:hypothetical protein
MSSRLILGSLSTASRASGRRLPPRALVERGSAISSLPSLPIRATMAGVSDESRVRGGGIGSPCALRYKQGREENSQLEQGAKPSHRRLFFCSSAGTSCQKIQLTWHALQALANLLRFLPLVVNSSGSSLSAALRTRLLEDPAANDWAVRRGGGARGADEAY